MRRFQTFRDSMQNTQSYKVATLEVWPSHWEERPCPISPWRDPSLKQRAATIPPMGPGAKTPLMGGIHWVPGGAWNTYQRPQIKERLMCSLNKYFPTAYSGPMLAAERTEMRYKQDLFPVMRKLISHPSPDFIWYTCTTIIFYSYSFLGINITLMRFVNPLENALDIAFFTSLWCLTQW